MAVAREREREARVEGLERERERVERFDGEEEGPAVWPPPSLSLNPFLISLVSLSTRQAYLILDEFILGGEIQETSKKVSERGGEREGQGWMESAGGLMRRGGGSGVPLPLSQLSLSLILQVILERLGELDRIET